MQDPQPDFNPTPGHIDPVAPMLRRILAPNPSPMTYKGTNTYILGDKSRAVIDPGPVDDAHLQAILAAGDGRISHILVTHAHIDHSPLARLLANETGAKIYAYGGATAGRSAFMDQLAADGLAGGGEGIDSEFTPDIVLADGDTVTTDEWSVQAIHTPGHLSNHLCFAWGDRLFSGDHVMGWATSLVSPPDGDLGAFMAACARLQQTNWSVFYPGHGDIVTDPNARLAELIAHRKMREGEILSALGEGPADAKTLAARIYTDVNLALLGAAARNVFAHLLDLYQRGLITSDDTIAATSQFKLKPASH